MRRSALVFLLASACFSESGVEDDDGGDASTSASTGDISTSTLSAGTASTSESTGQDTIDGTCGPDETCVPQSRPEGWVGPFAVRVDDPSGPALPCLDPWNESVGTFYVGFDAGEAACGCSCDPPSDVACGPVVVEHDAVAGCGGIDDTEVLDAKGVCESVGWGTGTFVRAPNVPLTATCTAMGTLAIGTQAAFAQRLSVCSSGVVEVCDDGQGTCEPNLPEGFDRLCILDYEGSETSCDDTGPFTAALPAFTGIEDLRTCEGACSCGVDEETCPFEITVFQNGSCNTGEMEWTLNEASACQQVAANSLRLESLAQPAANCSASAKTAAPVGSVAATAPVSLCCLP